MGRELDEAVQHLRGAQESCLEALFTVFHDWEEAGKPTFGGEVRLPVDDWHQVRAQIGAVMRAEAEVTEAGKAEAAQQALRLGGGL